MPQYEYECAACGRRFELIRKFSDPVVEACALCEKGPITRLQSAPAIQFKGSGFYITDYARQGGEKEKPDKASTEKSKDAKSDAAAAAKEGSSETKTDTAAKTDASAKSDAPTKCEAPVKPASSSASPSAPSAKD
jgi:putative FmdB family regulatory protein